MVEVEPAEGTEGVDFGMVRAGAAAAARRRELDISQRRLAADGIINAGALIAFEKGRSWPRERTRARLEEVLQWPPGTIARLRAGGDPAPPAPPGPRSATSSEAGGIEDGSLIAQAVDTAVHTLAGTIATLPDVTHPDFVARASSILADLRQLEAVAARAARIGRVTPPLLRALSGVRRQIDDLTRHAATAPGAPLAHRLYAARRDANLTVEETAQAAGVTEDVIVAAEAGESVPDRATALIEMLMGQLDWR